MPENVHSEHQITSKQEQLIAALLSLPTISAAAKAVKVNDKTARRWLKLPHFQEAYNTARHTAFDEALAVLMAGTSTALHVLLSAMKDTDAPQSARIRAAQIWLEQAIAVHKMGELEERLKGLEQLIKDRQL